MKPVPVLRITDTLADGYALWARSVALRPGVGAAAGQTYEVEDHMGRYWRLQLEEGAGARHDVIGTFSGRRRQPQPSLRGEFSLRRAGMRWTLFAMSAPREPEESRDAMAAPTPVITAVEQQALERVGAWLAQPAALPPAQDALGQGFLDAWQQAVASTRIWHAVLEQGHDQLRQRGVMTAQGQQAWLQGAAALLELVDLQRLLLGPRASAQPRALREQGLQQLQQLLGERLPALATPA